MNHSLFTLKQNNFKTPVNAVARSTLDADLCVLSLTLKLFSPKKKEKTKQPLRPLSYVSDLTEAE